MSFNPYPFSNDTFPTSSTNPHQTPDIAVRQLAIREKELELQIAQERRREREAELAILHLKRLGSTAQDGGTTRSPNEDGGYTRARTRQSSMGGGGAEMSPERSAYGGQSQIDAFGMTSPQNGIRGLQPTSVSYPAGPMDFTSLAIPPSDSKVLGQLAQPPHLPTTQSSLKFEDPTASTTLDINEFTNAFSPDFFNWLPEDLGALGGGGMAGETGFGFGMPSGLSSGLGAAAQQGVQPPVSISTEEQRAEFEQFQRDLEEVAKGRSLESDVGAGPSRLVPPSQRGQPPLPAPETSTIADTPTPPANLNTSSAPKKSVSKKETITTLANCSSCGTSIAKLLVRVPPSSHERELVPHYLCLECADRELTTRKNSASMTAVDAATVSQRKRFRVADDGDEHVGGRAICDVCQRMVGVGSVEREGEGLPVEVVCSGCDKKYSRCTDCGGGGGSGRLGIGKWRCKEMFLPGRKTCRIGHSRLGARMVELGVWETPTDLQDGHLMDEVLARCKSMWKEKTLARLAIPEVLECDTDGDPAHPLRTFADIEAKLERGWPIREDFIRNRDNDPKRIRRFLGLTWSPSRTRRGSMGGMDAERRDMDGAPRAGDGLQTVLPNVRRTNDVIPPACELSFQWVGEWNIQAGSLLISTSVPFDGSDGEDRSALSVGEMITKITQILQSLNQGRNPPLPQLEHLWVVSRNSSPLIRERLADALIRKRHFVTVDEYLTRFPSFRSSLTNRPGGLHPDLDPGDDEHDATTGQPLPPLILVRWLGTTSAQNNEKLNELKQIEFAGGNKPKKGRPRKAAKMAGETL